MSNFNYKYYHLTRGETLDQNNIKVFTYEDYIYYKGRLCNCVKEPEVEYELKKIHQHKDKGYKLVLSNKNEAARLISKAIKKDIKENEIEEYSSSFITTKFKSKEADIVFKIKNKNIFFLIEQQSKVDYSMPYRILNYCVEIMNSAVDENKIKRKDYKLPNVYAIVLYTGKTKWNPKRYFEECQERLEGTRTYGFTSYNLIDINEYEEDELWKEDSFLSKMLLLEKAKQNKKIPQYIDKIKNENLTKEQMHIIIQMIYNTVDRKFGQETVQDLIKRLEEGGDSMSAFEEYLESLIDEGLERGLEQGLEQGLERGLEQGLEREKQKIKEIVIRMLQNNMDENTIKLMTQVTQEELEEIKQEIQLKIAKNT